MCLFEQAHNKARKAAKIIDKLVLLRRNQAKGEGVVPEQVDQIQLGRVDYDALTAPFLYKLGDTLASYIETNTDVMNNLKPFEYEESSSDEEPSETEGAQEEEDPREESKGDQPEQIDTSVPKVEEVVYGEDSKPVPEAGGEEAEKPPEDLEQDAQDYLSLSL